MARQPGARARAAAESLLAEARQRFEAAAAAEEDNRAEAFDDLRFRAGEQWPEAVLSERESDGRPVLTINRMPQFVRQITGDVRIARPSIKVRPIDDETDPGVAEVLTGLIRHIEQASQARIAYVTAVEGAATCGIGHFRILTAYADDGGFDQDIRIARITNPLAVYSDPQAAELTRADARFCFVVEDLEIDEFRQRWPNARLVDFEAGDELRHWRAGGRIRVAEYWRKVPVEQTLSLAADGRVFAEGEVPAGVEIVRTRRATVHTVEQTILTGAEVLEGPHAWPGRLIPIVPVIGEEVHVGPETRRHGIIRFAKDAQRLYNYWRSTAAETIALAPKAPFVGTVRQFAGLERYWRQANRANLPYLPYNPDGAAPPPQRQAPAEVPSAIVSEIVHAAEDLKATTGIYDAGLGAQSNETSGRAILFRQREGDVGTYAYADNLAIAIEHAGRILVDLIPRVYDGERMVRILGEDGVESLVALNRSIEEAGGVRVLNDLSVGRYDVTVTTGPAFTTRRHEAAESLMAFAQSNPAVAALVIDLVAKNMDWPGADEIAERLSALRPGAAPAAPDPERAANAAKISAEAAKAQAEAEGKALENIGLRLALARQAGPAAARAMQGASPDGMQGASQAAPHGAPGSMAEQAARRAALAELARRMTGRGAPASPDASAAALAARRRPPMPGDPPTGPFDAPRDPRTSRV